MADEIGNDSSLSTLVEHIYRMPVIQHMDDVKRRAFANRVGIEVWDQWSRLSRRRNEKKIVVAKVPTEPGWLRATAWTCWAIFALHYLAVPIAQMAGVEVEIKELDFAVFAPMLLAILDLWSRIKNPNDG